jgi:serine/threonine protein kinase
MPVCAVFVVMELARGDIFRFLKSQPDRRFSDDHAALFIRQLVEALLFLHDQVDGGGIMAREGPPGGVHCVITDCGLEGI